MGIEIMFTYLSVLAIFAATAAVCAYGTYIVLKGIVYLVMYPFVVAAEKKLGQ